MFVRLSLALAVLVLANPLSAREALPVVASFSILADLAGEVGGDRVAVSALVKEDSDGHVFEPSPVDARKLAGAAVIVVNGLGFEGWLDRLVRASGTEGEVVVASRGIDVLTDERGTADPHAWHDASNVQVYVDNIAEAFCAADAAGCGHYRARARSYAKTLQELDSWIRESLDRFPRHQRRVIVAHGAFAYYGRSYGVTFLSPRGLNTDSEPSARDLAALITQVRNSGAGVLFVENIGDPRIVSQIAGETGVRAGGSLYSDALSAAGGGATTYIGLMRRNTQAIVDGLEVAGRQ